MKKFINVFFAVVFFVILFALITNGFNLKITCFVVGSIALVFILALIPDNREKIQEMEEKKTGNRRKKTEYRRKKILFCRA